MLETIISSVITGSLALLGVVITSRAQHDKTMAEITKQNAVSFEKFNGEMNLIKNDIKNLEKKQDKHNNLIERMYAVEKAVEVIQERQKTANHRIDDLEEESKEG